MKLKAIFIIGAMVTVGLAACGKPQTETIQETTEMTQETSETTQETTQATTSENTSETTQETTSETIQETETTQESKEQYADPTVDIPQDKEEDVIYNGGDSDVTASVGDYISLTEATGGGYEVGNIEILSGDSVSVSGKDSVIAEKKGTSIVRCTLFDEETNTKTETDLTIIIK